MEIDYMVSCWRAAASNNSLIKPEVKQSQIWHVEDSVVSRIFTVQNRKKKSTLKVS